jgi:hypothetical protein
MDLRRFAPIPLLQGNPLLRTGEQQQDKSRLRLCVHDPGYGENPDCYMGRWAVAFMVTVLLLHFDMASANNHFSKHKNLMKKPGASHHRRGEDISTQAHQIYLRRTGPLSLKSQHGKELKVKANIAKDESKMQAKVKTFRDTIRKNSKKPHHN